MTALAPARPRGLTHPLPMFRRWIADGWRGLVGWSAGVAVAILVYLPLFPSMNSPEFAGLIDALPAELVRTLGYGDIGSGAGYAQATFFGLIGFVLITIAGIGWGSAFIGGAEESGRLELVLAHGVGRVQYALESAAALLVKMLVLGLVAWVLVWSINGPAELGLDEVNLLFVTKAWVGLGFLSATAALAAGALSGRRSWGAGAGAGVAIVGYVLQAVANNSEDLDWLRVLSPFDWAYGEAPLANGVDWTGLALLWGASALLVVVTTITVRQKDVLG